MKKVTKTSVIATEYEIEEGTLLTDVSGDLFLATFVVVSTQVGAADDGSDFTSVTVKGYPVTKAGTRKPGSSLRSYYLFDAAQESLLWWLRNETSV